ncbi:regulatory protein RecX [Kocuria marina]|uniref:Regulatory protein RecX n=1 Tax=Kocuria marina subsp. indica TaxID=1049583 RepID=A0A1X7CW58_9MICC|nr:RecX family transcriptional regulator [Kocuria indica]RLP58264.1 regulatory protein RecX [Kocuria indica]SMF04264.1 regulatory protein [Kocuria indica]
MTESERYGSRRRRASDSHWGPAAPPASAESSGEAEADPREVARAIVLRQLSASAKSRRQLEDKLADRNVPEDVAREVLDRFEEVNLVDDRAYAGMFVRSRAETRRLSRSALRRELAQRGITGEIADEALEQRSDHDELRDAHALVRKKLPASLDPSDRKERDRLTRRLVSMLGRKGYPPGLAFAVVKEELGALESSAEEFESEEFAGDEFSADGFPGDGSSGDEYAAGGSTVGGRDRPDPDGAHVWDTP